ncbi:hypothetical protein C8J57DRAFT_1363867 [Mycena rebaudengoi]|nr:hypothetical protein C8J57DRAFT_1379816 [Mycena rebaudengoi]KAJ7244456.1 hypothetical protein C8J57DRAFT_1363867 [Mycena rebaudengoi]
MKLRCSFASGGLFLYMRRVGPVLIFLFFCSYISSPPSLPKSYYTFLTSTPPFASNTHLHYINPISTRLFLSFLSSTRPNFTAQFCVRVSFLPYLPSSRPRASFPDLPFLPFIQALCYFKPILRSHQ